MKFLAVISLCFFVSLTSFSQAAKPKPAGSKPKPAATPQKKPDDKTEFDKAAATAVTADRIAALRKFLETFAASEKRNEALGLISAGEAELGNDKLKAGDVPAAAEYFKAAAKDAPKPVPAQLFTETLLKFPANLYFRGMRDEALEIAKTLEERSDSSIGQMLDIAGFYMTVEDGADARRLATVAVVLEPTSAAAYQTLGLANRIDFRLDESAVAYAKALELDPDSLAARRGLAEMKRSLGKADEAAVLYREILAKDDTDLPARTGLILTLFDAGKRAEAEAEMTKSLEANPGNVILLGGAAYWYAAHNEADKAVYTAQKAVEAEPRFIWSHIALARGLLLQKKPLEAERTLLAARQYGNFPSLDYELAAAQAAAGFYQDASETLGASFDLKDGAVTTMLGRRVAKDGQDLSELVSFERRASIFAPTAADDPENSAKLRSLMAFTQELAAATPNAEAATAAADAFVRGDDKMKAYRQMFVATRLLEKKIALPKVLELAKQASANIDGGLDAPSPSSAVLADEFYDSRVSAIQRGVYVSVPDVPRATLSAIMRGRVEEISGWALYQMNNAAESVLRLKRAVSVMPPDSSYLRSSMWRLGSALLLADKDAEALDAFLKSYRPGDQDPVKYKVIETVYKRVNGSTDGLEGKIGPNPTPARPAEPAPTLDAKVEPTPAVKPVPSPAPPVPSIVPIKEEPKPMPAATPEESKPTPTPTPEETKSTPSPTPEEVKPTPTPRPEETEPAPSPTPEEIRPTPTPTPEETKPAAVPDVAPTPTPETATATQKTPDEKPTGAVAGTKAADKTTDLFPPVVITIPQPDTPKKAKTGTEPKPEPTPSKTPDGAAQPGDERVSEPGSGEIKPCTITPSEERVTLQNNGGNLVILVSVDGDVDLKSIVAHSSSPADVSIVKELDSASVKGRALFLVRSVSTKPGLYQVSFELPCGKKVVKVSVR